MKVAIQRRRVDRAQHIEQVDMRPRGQRHHLSVCSLAIGQRRCLLLFAARRIL
jgi:hypothetical protein